LLLSRLAVALAAIQTTREPAMIGNYPESEFVVYVDDDETDAPARVISAAEIAAMDRRIKAAVTGGTFADALARHDDESDPHLRKQTEGTVTDKRQDESGQMVDKILKHFDDALKMHADALNKRMDSMEEQYRKDRAKRKADGHFDGEEGEETEEERELARKREKGDGDLHLRHEGKDENEPVEEREQKEKAREVVASTHADSADSAINAQWRVRMDEVLGGLGTETPKVLAGESTRPYRQRVMRGLRKYSPKFKEVDLGTLNAAAFDAVSEAIMVDVAEAARRGPDVPEGAGIVEVKRRDPTTNRVISTFYGKNTFIKEMKRPARYIKTFYPHGGSTTAA
jgi:hypothetical protein